MDRKVKYLHETSVHMKKKCVSADTFVVKVLAIQGFSTATTNYRAVRKP